MVKLGFFHALKKSWSRPVNFLVVPQGPLPQWRLRFTMPFMLFLLGLWGLSVIGAGLIFARQFDYAVTKAENKVLQAKLAFIAGEIATGRRDLEAMRQTERQLRKLLGMNSREAIIQEGEGMGGPTRAEMMGFRQIMAKRPTEISESVFRRDIKDVTRRARQELDSFKEISLYITNERIRYRATPTIWPAAGTITSSYGYRFSPFGGEDSDFHSGLDISNQIGSPIFATADGVVRHIGWAPGYGKAVLLDHGFGYSTLYGHVNDFKVKEGQRVSRGQVIALMGRTGRTTGVHVHYEVWIEGKAVNPMPYLRGWQKKPFRR